MNDTGHHQHGAVEPAGVRPAAGADLGRVAEIRTISWQTAYRGIVDDSVLDALGADVEAGR